MLDYIVVGLGIGGVSFCETLRAKGKSFKVINDYSQCASKVAGGIYNPVILKRFTLSWKAPEQLKIALPFYNDLQDFLDVELIKQLPVFRRFTNIEEQNLWFEAADKPSLKPYLSATLHSNTNNALNVPLGLGEVLNTGRLDIQQLLSMYEDWLKKENSIVVEGFQHNQLKQEKECISYKGLLAKHIIFSEGFGLTKNPYFNYLPMQGSKGEYLIIKADKLQEVNCIKSSIFIIPLGNGLYKIGATYDNIEKTNSATELARNELFKKVSEVVNCPFTIVDQVAGVRPTVKDRRPLVGRHPNFKDIYVLNGFGSHGIMIAPWASQALYNFIELNEQLLPELDIKRFGNPKY